jgi:cysteine desulfuration protein SufE
MKNTNMSLLCFETIINDFTALQDWEQKYLYLIELGLTLPTLDPKLKTDTNKISDCQSRVWLAYTITNRQLVFTGDSDSMLVKGLLALYIYYYNHQTPAQILENQLPNNQPPFLIKLSLDKNLSLVRLNGLNSINQKILQFAKEQL